MSLGGNLTHTTGAGSMTTSGAGAYNGVITFNGSGTQTLSIPTPGAAIWVVYSVPSGKSVQLLFEYYFEQRQWGYRDSMAGRDNCQWHI